MKKGFSLGFLMMMSITIIMVFQFDVGIAIPVPMKGNNATHTYKGNCDATIEECLIPNHWEEREVEEADFSFNSHVSRMLFDISGAVTGKTGKKDSPSVSCPVSQGYRSCTPPKNPGGQRPNCVDNAYNRNCG